MPRSAFGSLPVISHVIVVGEDSDSCSKVTVPVIFESPRTVATRIAGIPGQHRLVEVHRAKDLERDLFKQMPARKGLRACPSGLRLLKL